MKIKEFFDKTTSTLTYIVYDEATYDCVIIDPVLNYEVNSSKIHKKSVDDLCLFIKSNELKPLAVLETHAHADHISGAYELRVRYPKLKICISENITKVQKVFKSLFNLPSLNADGSQFDQLLSDNVEYSFGSLVFKVILTPGHTPACASFLIEDNLFCGDALFMPDIGCARCDFPDGSATELYNSIKNKIYILPEETKTFTAHDYPGSNPYRFKSSIKAQKIENKMIQDTCSLDEFVMKREERDAQLDAPRLLLPSLQINIEAGKLPIVEKNEMAYLKIPLTIED